MNRLLYVAILACVVVYASYRSSDWKTILDRVLLGSAFVLLLFFVIGDDAEIGEQFTTENAGDDAADPHSGIFRENLARIRGLGKLLFYTTAFHPDSTNGVANNMWKSVASDSDQNAFEISGDFSFDDEIKKLNILGKMEGPQTASLGITNQQTITVFVVMNNYTFDDWLEAHTPVTEVELFKMFGNVDESNTNFFSAGFTNHNQDDVVTLKLRYTNQEFSLDETLEIDPTATYVYAFVVSQESTPTVTVKRAKVGDSGFAEVARWETPAGGKVANPLLNLPISFNASGLLKMNLYNFAVFDKTMGDAELLAALEHFSENFSPVDTRCPYNDATCFSDECIGIEDWSDPMAVADSAACRAKVAEYCRGNFSEPVCKCWDPDNGDYSSTKCKLWRAFIGNAPDSLFSAEGLSADQVNQVKQHHLLVTTASRDAAVEEATKAAKKEAEDKAAKLEAERKKADEETQKRIVNYYDEKPQVIEVASDSTGEDSSASGSKTGLIDYWKSPPRPTTKPSPDDDDDVKAIVDPYKAAVNKFPARAPSMPAAKKIPRLRELGPVESGEPEKSGPFAWFRGLFS